MSLSSVSSASYSSIIIQASSSLFSSSTERLDAQKTEKSSDHRSDRRDDEYRREAKHEDSRRSHESERRNPFGEISDLRRAFEAFRGEDRSGDHGDDDDRRSYQSLQSYSASSISININFSSILQLQEIDAAPEPAVIAAPAAPEPVVIAAPEAPAPQPAPQPALPQPAEIVTTAPQPISTPEPFALPEGFEDTLQSLISLLETQSSSLSISGDGAVYQSLSFEAQYTSFSLEINDDQSYQVDLTSISIAFSQSSYSFTNGASSFAETEFSLDIQAYSASFSAQAYSNALVSDLLSDQGALFA